jgi:hypothetical protein
MEDIDHIHSPGEGKPKRSTQVISLFVGAILFIIGLSGILYSGFAGLHLSAPYSTIIAAAGVILFYNGYKNNSRDAFLSCLGFTVFFGLHAIAGWTLGKPGVPNVGYSTMDPKWIQIIPNFHELGRNDHILNTILALVLLGGTIDWWRRNTEKGHRTEPFKDVKREHRSSTQHRNDPIHH